MARRVVEACEDLRSVVIEDLTPPAAVWTIEGGTRPDGNDASARQADPGGRRA